MERGSQSHRVDHEHHRVVELEPDDLEQVSRPIRPNGEDTRWIGVGVKVSDDNRMVERMQDLDVVDAVLACRTVFLASGYRITKSEPWEPKTQGPRSRRDNAPGRAAGDAKARHQSTAT